MDPSKYTTTSGSTIITLHEDYLKTFANGTYTFEAAFQAGYAPLKLIVSTQPGSPRTGDASQAAIMATVALSSIAMLILIQKRRKLTE